MDSCNTALLRERPLADPGGRAPTRSSFVARLKDWGDQTIWEGFFQRYGRLVRQAAVRSGLSADEAEDVVQETALSVARKMPDFVYDRTRCSFEGWVRHVARWRKFVVMHEYHLKEMRLVVTRTGPGWDVRDDWRGHLKNRANPIVFGFFRPFCWIEDYVRGSTRSMP
jgi:hypothetical protein